MSHNIFHTGVEWLGENVVEPVKDAYKDYQYKSWIEENLGGPTRMTKELEEAGWKEGLDGIPYNTNLIYTADDWARDQENAANDASVANAVAGGGTTGGTAGGGAATSGGVLVPQDLRQRTPSGTMYEPDLSEYEASSLFDYAGPGGLDEYTYGQGLPTEGADYGIWGTPTDVPNPYYWGQFGEGFVEPEVPGIADGAISLPPIDMPAGVPPTNNNPNVGTNTTNITTGGGTGPGGKDLTYQETIDYFGLTPTSTTFPGPNDKLVEEAIMNQNAVKTNPLYSIPDLYTAGGNANNVMSDYAYFKGAEDKAIQAAIDAGYSGTSEITDFSDALYEGDDPVLKDRALRAYKKILAADNQIKTTGHSRDGIGTQTAGVKPNTLYDIPDLYTAGGSANNVASDYANFTGINAAPTNSGLDASLGWREGTANNPNLFDNSPSYASGELQAIDNYLNNNNLDLGRPGDPSYEEFQPANSGLQWVDTGNNPDVGNRYDNAEDKAIAESILGGEAYGQLVYNNDPVAQAIPGLLGNPNEYNLGRPTDSNYVPFEPFESNVPSIFKPQTYSAYAEPGGVVQTGPQFGGGAVRIKQLGDTVITDPSYATELLSTGQIVDVNPITGTYTGTNYFKDRPPRL